MPPAEASTRSVALTGGRPGRHSARRFPAAFLLLGIALLASCASLKPVPPERQKTLVVTATAFNSVPGQGRGNADVGAWGDRLTPGMHAVAVSADLEALGLVRGTRVRIAGLRHEYVVLDRMPAKWKKRIDIYMGKDVNAARSWGRREVTISWKAAE